MTFVQIQHETAKKKSRNGNTFGE